MQKKWESVGTTYPMLGMASEIQESLAPAAVLANVFVPGAESWVEVLGVDGKVKNKVDLDVFGQLPVMYGLRRCFEMCR